MKRIVSLLLAFAMLIGMLPLTVRAETLVMNGTHGDNLSWNYDESTNTLTISGTGAMESCDSDAYPWKELWEVAKTVELESGITSIADYAFDGMFELTKVVIPDTVTAIGNFAFYGCANIEDISIPNSVESIGDYAFNDCQEITSITFSKDITYIGEYAFWSCVGITEMTFPGDAPDTIGENAFDNVTAIAYYPAHNNTWAESNRQDYGGTITWNAIADYGDHSFGEWYETKAATTETEGEERRDCSGCDHYEIRIKEKLPSSDDGKIGGTCGENLTWIFDKASGILTISGSGAMDDFTSSNYPWRSYSSKIQQVTITNGVTSIGKCAFYDCKNITTITMAEGIISIGESAFRGCESLTGAVIPQSVTSIGRSTFYDCESLTEIVLPNSVTEIGNSAFCGCKNIVTVTIGDGINAISSSLFSGCRSLKTVAISASVNSIGNSAFQSCIALETVYFGGTERAWNKMALRDALEEDNEVLASATVYFGAEDAVSFDGGNGMTNSPYLVSTAAQLNVVRDDLKAHYVQTADIDLAGIEWEPIGEYTEDKETWFTGSYNGQKYAISNMSITKMPVNHVTVGLFGINDGTLKNIVLKKSNIQINTVINDDLYGNACFGGIVGNNKRTVVGCSNSGRIDVNVVSDWSVDVGGIVGSGFSDIQSVLESCTNYAQITVSGTGDESTIDLRCGGIVGYPGAINRDVVSCINYGNVIGTLNAYDTQSSICCGGITGHHGELICCVNYGDISGKINSVDIFYGPHTCSVGGLSGYTAAGDANYDGSVDCVNFGSVEAHSTNDGVHVHAGGLFGYLTGEATNCYNLASSVHADSFEGADNKSFSYVGRISGRSGELNNCYSIATTVVGAGEAESISMQGISMTESQIYFAIADILTSLGLPVPEVEKESDGASVRYFRKWDADTQTAYWGEDPPAVEGLDLGSQVTAETDKSFMDNVDNLVGTYVLVETKTRTDGMLLPDTLISIKPLESVGVGTVTAIATTDGTITIDGVTYFYTFEFMEAVPEVGDTVRFYIESGKLLGFGLLTPVEGFLIKWDQTTDEITIRKADDAETENTYVFAGYMDQTSVDLLNKWSLYNDVYEEVTANIRFIADKNYVYRIDGEVSRNLDFNEKIYRTDYLLSDVGHNLDFYIRFINQYSPSRMILNINNLSNMNEVWSAITVTLDTFADGDGYAKYKFEQADIYETILLNALEASVDFGSEVGWANKTIKETTETTKQIFKNVKRILEFKDDLDITEYPDLNTMTLEQKMMLKDALTNELKDGPYTGCIFATSKASDVLDSIMIAATTVEDFITKILIYEKLWEVSESMAVIIDEMYANTPADAKYTAMRDALTFCSQMIRECNREQFEDMAILRSGVFASDQILEKGISFIWGKVMDMAKAANPELRILLFGYKAGRTLTNLLCDIDDLSEEIYKLNAVNQYGAALNSATSTVINRYNQNRSVSNAEVVLSALKLQFSLACEDCDIACSYADVVDGAMLNKIGDAIAALTGNSDEVDKTDDLKSFAENRKRDFQNFSDEADTYWIFELKQDYPELYPEYSDRLGIDTDNDDVLVVPITSSYAIKCPVNVTIYDRNGNLVVDFGKTESYVSDSLLALTAGDHKYIDLYNDQEYRIACVGYDDGIMSISISEYVGAKKVRSAFFNNLVVHDGIEYETVTKTNPEDKEIHTVICDGSIIRADFDSNIQTDTTEHTHSGGSATCTQKAICIVCGVSYGELASHDYETTWDQGNANGHWHKCKNCSAHDTQVKHTPGAAATENTAQTCTECGYVIVPAAGHVTHTVGSEWFSDGNSHWHKCTGCNEKLEMTTHSGGTATCTKKAVCSVCGTSYGELAPHDYETTWSQGNANGHWHECKNCSAHDTQVKHAPGAAATATTAQTCTVCGYVITPALGHTCTAGSKWYSNGTYHWHVCTSCGSWAKTSYHNYSSDTDETCDVCGYARTVTATEPTEETEVAMTETTETTGHGEEVIATETAPTIVSTETNENLSDNAVSEDTDSHGVSGLLITAFVIVALGSLAALVILLVYKKRRESE